MVYQPPYVQRSRRQGQSTTPLGNMVRGQRAARRDYRLPRHAAWTPGHGRPQHRRQRQGTTVAQVRLLRLSRQLRELQRRPQDEALRRNAGRALRSLTRRWPELQAYENMDEEAARFVTQLAQDEAEAARRDALLTWRAGISEDVKAQRRWIRREPAAQARRRRRESRG